MSDKITILAFHVHPDEGIEIELAEDLNELISHNTLIGILEQVKFNLLKKNAMEPMKKNRSTNNYDA